MSLKNKLFTVNNLLSQNEFNVLQQYLKSISFDKESNVFSLLKQENINDKTIRNSRTVIDNNDQLLTFVKENIIKKLSDKFKLKMKLSRDFVTFIKYEKDGFFKEHIDFEKYKLNDSVEMHLIYCIEEPESGGDLKVLQDEKYVLIKEVRTKNSCVIFDKKLNHSAEKVTKGNKIIMTIDVLVNLDLENTDIKNSEIFKEFNDQNPLLTTHSSSEFRNMLKFLDDKTMSPFIFLQSEEKFYYADLHSTCIGRYDESEEIICDENEDDSPSDIMNLDEALRRIIDYEDLNFYDYVSENFKNMYEIISNSKLKKIFSTKITHDQIQYIISDLIGDFERSDVEEIAGTYHCNEPNYGTFKVSILGGFFNNTFNIEPDESEEENTE